VFLVGLPTILLVEVLLLAPICAATKWALMGRYREGNYPLWGWMYLRWWMVSACPVAQRYTQLSAYK
jgi:hypothetical protein